LAQSPGYRLQFLQHYLASRAGQNNMHIHMDNTWVILGPDRAVKFGKNKRTIFRWVSYRQWCGSEFIFFGFGF
jgi:hypothetical protein